MSRLIDADEFIKNFSYAKANAEENIMCATVGRMVKEQPTAFDVEKVIEQLENIKAYDACPEELRYLCKYSNHCFYREEVELRALDKAIEIVKRGGKNEE